MAFILSDVNGHAAQSSSTIDEQAVGPSNEVAKWGAVATPKEGIKEMDLDLSSMEEGDEAKDGNDNILETEDDLLNLSNVEEIGIEEEETKEPE